MVILTDQMFSLREQFIRMVILTDQMFSLREQFILSRDVIFNQAR